MPPIKPSPERQSLEVADREIHSIREKCGLKDRKKIMIICGFGQKAYYTREKRIGEYKLSELQRLAKKTKMNPMQAASIMLGREVTVRDFEDFMIR